MKIIRAEDYNQMSDLACEKIIETCQTVKRPVFGLATGDTPNGLYERLIQKYEQKEVSFEHATTFNLDEYVGYSKEHSKSYHYYMSERLFNHINIREDHAHVPNGAALNLQEECVSYEQKIKEAGRINIQLLGLGANGHIGFNEPGTPFDSRTEVVFLADSTRQSNARFFPSIEDVPKTAISMGIGTIMESEEILLLVSGEQKADILAHVLNSEPSEEFPATVLHNHEKVTIIADKGALSKVKGF
ncbi:MAG TPA: glucosamine-6-phosphate deaminase [Bacillota bacterium]|nr:glucosamine-6-phosphate deaminase [Bacillota bacterium]